MNQINRQFVPMTKEEMAARGWKSIDILLITGDAYVDHPSFGVPLLARLLIKEGYKVGIISQPIYPGFTGPKGEKGIKNQRPKATLEECVENIKKLGNPNLFVGISSGVVDSMINNYTANRKPRSDDQYSEGGSGGMRPDYAVEVYSKIVRAAFPNKTIIAGGVEASLRRLAHFDFWQNRVRPSYLMDIDADFIVYGMGERQILSIANALKLKSKEEAFKDIKKERGIVYLDTKENVKTLTNYKTIPSFEEIKEDKKKFAKASLFAEIECVNPYAAKTIIQYHGNKAIVVNPPAFPLATEEMDALYDTGFTKDPHYSYEDKIPAADMIRFSITVNRGCFGSCSFCGLSLHQGKVVQSRSIHSIVKEAEALTHHKKFTGIITDLGGPTANMYKLGCSNPKAKATCQKISCLHPEVCENLDKNHSPQVELLKKVRTIKGVKRVFIASGIRHDLAIYDEKYIKELVTNHVGGHLKLAPEHVDEEVLFYMKKPSLAVFEEFREKFEKYSKEAHKEQFIVPYFISNFPSCTEEKMSKVNNWLKDENWRLQQVQSFIPLPMTLATAMYYSGIDPETKKELFVAKDKHEKKKQQILLQPHKFAKINKKRR